jgi:hypothetical protein
MSAALSGRNLYEYSGLSIIAVPFGRVAFIVGDCILLGMELSPEGGMAAQSQYGCTSQHIV